MSDAYDRVADVIGKEMDKAWRNILTNLASSNVGTLSSGGAKITAVELQEFFANLGGCQMGIRFSSIKPKGESVWFNAEQLKPSTGITTMGVSGSVSIGVSISF
ncbi:hypothetical protein [Hydrogenophaga sp.]|uniref:hypothetical protein n=1 Tax=Hydrogenophaga sp. TaxID=1904254 RepID=UPI0025BC3F89|nr:hypothetical protein [Hydrogenophaga sp.]